MAGQTSKVHKILVLGVGELGLAAVEAFANHLKGSDGTKDQQIRLTVARSASSGNEALNDHIVALGARLVRKDVAGSSQEELATFFSEHDTIVSCSGFGPALGTHLKLAKAFVASTATTYLPWQYGVDYDTIGRNSAYELFDEQLAVRDLLREEIGDETQGDASNRPDSKRRWVIISTGMFSSFIVVPAFGVITDPSGKGEQYLVRGLNSNDDKVTLTSVEDIGKCIVHVVLQDTGVIGVVFIAGETLTYGEVADAVQTVTQKPVIKQPRPLDELKSDLAAKTDQGKGDEAIMEKYRVVFGSGIGVSWPVEQTYSHKTGIDMTPFTEWLRVKWLPTQP